MSIHIIIELNENIVDETHAIDHAREIAYQLGRCANDVRVESGRDTLIELTPEDFDVLMDAAREIGRLEVKAEMLAESKKWRDAAGDTEGFDAAYRDRARTRSAQYSHYARNHI